MVCVGGGLQKHRFFLTDLFQSVHHTHTHKTVVSGTRPPESDKLYIEQLRFNTLFVLFGSD